MHKGKWYWLENSREYPFQVEVAHMSPQDIDPRRYANMTKDYFLRVPFNGKAHWGFKTQQALDNFKRAARVL